MADFSEEEDRRLVQLAICEGWKQGELGGGGNKDEASYMVSIEAPTSSEDTQEKQCVSFPSPFFAKLLPMRPSVKATTKTIAPRPCHCSFDSRETIPSNGCPISPDAPWGVTKRHLNVGDITMEAISKLIEVANFEDNDVFLDVGSGVGNVLVQVALQTLEIRTSLVTITMELITDTSKRFSHLLKIKAYEADIRTITRDTKYFEPTSLAEPELLILSTTTLFCHDVVFEEDANLAVRDLFVVLPFLRLVALTTSVCLRHRCSCLNSFCQIWDLTTTFQVPITYGSSLRQLYMYTNRAS
ncbi:LOW QUALITY PROTEIN: hypothetical protein PHMEG_00027681 [Phytophthora megakarya]|uniref:DOT1 domain-containing protein n=1 Tax=Phytophthora megakarya TaxID=4795 RepID=A0A225V9A2_9STRA|nr:LOW QUALITY PROTEIN: hypothetical protein PHMEG_00027681 [Phytophthora megakarya]